MIAVDYLHVIRAAHARHDNMKTNACPQLHATRETSERAKAISALAKLEEIDLAHAKHDMYNKIATLARDVENYVCDTKIHSSTDRSCTWLNKHVKPVQAYVTNEAGDKMLVAASAARLLVPLAHQQLYDVAQPNQAHALAKRAQSLAEAAQAALYSHVFVQNALPPVIGQKAAVTATALAAAALADLSVVAKQGNAIFNTQGTPPAPGTRLHALFRLATSSAVRALAAARLAHPEDAAQKPGTTFASAMAYRSAVAAAMDRALDDDGAVGRQVYALKQVSALSKYLLSSDQVACQNAMDAAWMRNGLRLESEIAPEILLPTRALLSTEYMGMCRNKASEAPVWALAQ